MRYPIESSKTSSYFLYYKCCRTHKFLHHFLILQEQFLLLLQAGKAYLNMKNICNGIIDRSDLHLTYTTAIIKCLWVYYCCRYLPWLFQDMYSSVQQQLQPPLISFFCQVENIFCCNVLHQILSS